MSKLTEAEALRIQLKRWRLDPLSFIRKAFGVEPTPQQVPIINDFAQPGAKVSVKAGHGVGKTGLAAWLAIWHTLLFADSKAVATAPSASQLKDVLMAEIGKWLAQAHPWVRSQLVYSTMRLSVKGREATQFLTARTARPEQPDALQGIHATNAAYFIEEAFGVADPIFEVARGALSTPNSRALLIGNPTATTGYAFNTHHRNSRLWKCHTLSCIGSPLVSKEYVEDMRSEYGEDSDIYKVRVLGEFPETSANQLISRKLAEESAAKKLNEHDYAFAPVVIGVDCAWEGDDRFAVYLRQGLMARKLGSWYKINAMTLGGMVDQWWTQYNADAVFIDVGYGTGVIDYLRSIHRNPMPVYFGGSSLDPQYVNKRTEMWFGIKTWLEQGGVIENDGALIEDLVSPEFYYQPNGKKVLERKEDMKKRGLKSPDLADALACTFHSPVRKLSPIQVMQRKYGKQKMCKTDFNFLT